MNILFIGDVFGKPGRDLIRRGLRPLVHHYDIDFVVANVENAAGGFGVTREIGDSLAAGGIDVMTSGNHIWDKKEAVDYVAAQPRLLRPANYPAGNPGRGACVVKSRDGVAVAVLNLQGLTFMTPIESPFTVADRLLASLTGQARVVVVDMHAEATSEKQAMAWYLDGRASAVLGTHTHVPTADERILPNGTATLTDVGMTGPFGGIIGFKPGPVLERFLLGTPRPFEPATTGGTLSAAVVDVDEATGRARAIRRLRIEEDRSA